MATLPGVSPSAQSWLQRAEGLFCHYSTAGTSCQFSQYRIKRIVRSKCGTVSALDSMWDKKTPYHLPLQSPHHELPNKLEGSKPLDSAQGCIYDHGLHQKTASIFSPMPRDFNFSPLFIVIAHNLRVTEIPKKTVIIRREPKLKFLPWIPSNHTSLHTFATWSDPDQASALAPSFGDRALHGKPCS